MKNANDAHSRDEKETGEQERLIRFLPLARSYATEAASAGQIR